MSAYSSHAVGPLAVVAGSMVLAVAACGGAQTPSAGPTATVTATETATATVTATPSAASPASAGAGGACAVSGLRIHYADDQGGAGAGSVMGTLTFTNTGSAPCTLRGFPGVSYVAGTAGTQVGQPATRTDDAVKTRTLAPGKSATAALRRSQAGNYGDQCSATKVDGLRVYPPDSTESTVVAFKATGCKSTSAPLLQVGPVG
jgi:Protein of unknown function (DUF4232)